MCHAVQAVGSAGTLRPVHLLVGASEVAGPVADALRDRGSGTLSLRELLGLPAPSGESYSATFAPGAGQAEASARAWANQRGEGAGPEHLLVVLLDQGDASVRAALTRAGADADELRQVALRALGAPPGLAPVPLIPPPHWPAGTGSNPPLPLSELPAEAWAALRARQDRLPLSHLHRTSDWYAIMSNESRAARRLAGRLGLDEDRTYSLLYHHDDAMTRRAHEVAPRIVGVPRDAAEPPRVDAGFIAGPVPWHFRHPLWAGWGCWFGNRRVDARAAWLRLTVQH